MPILCPLHFLLVAPENKYQRENMTIYCLIGNLFLHGELVFNDHFFPVTILWDHFSFSSHILSYILRGSVVLLKYPLHLRLYVCTCLVNVAATAVKLLHTKKHLVFRFTSKRVSKYHRCTRQLLYLIIHWSEGSKLIVSNLNLMCSYVISN